MTKAGELLAGILTRDDSTIVFLHNTPSISKARSILSNGFRFESQLTYSTDRINPRDPVEINYFMVERKEYGDFTVIIQIDRDLFRKYLSLADSSDMAIEDIITIDPPFMSDNDEMVYTISHYYIRGIFNNKTGEFKENPVFDPKFDSPVYTENFKRSIG